MKSQDWNWTSFFFTGANTLPAFMVLNNENSVELAFAGYVVLMFCAVTYALRDHGKSVRGVLARQRAPRNRRD